MLITRHFALIHLPKTGGSFLRKVCLAGLPRDWFVPNSHHPHVGYRAIEAEFPDLPAFTVVRNPWDWYVSWYHFILNWFGEKHPNVVWQQVFRQGRSSFREVVVSACTGENFIEPRADQLRRYDIDHFSLLHYRWVGGGRETGRVSVGRFESLTADFIDFLERHDVPIENAFADSVRDAPPYLTSKRGPYRDYYDDELRELVARKARQLIADYGYEF